MSLVSFHRALIVVAIAFCLGYSGWELREWQAEGGTGALLLAALFALLGLALTVYVARLGSILKLDD